jgi:hypothetical protein
MSAPVKGRLLELVEVGVTDEPTTEGPVEAALEADGVVEAPEMIGVTTQPVSVMLAGETQVAAPATPDAMANDASAKPEPINNRLAHIMVALLPVGTMPCVPLTDHDLCCDQVA